MLVTTIGIRVGKTYNFVIGNAEIFVIEKKAIKIFMTD
jgi:hypothetical protein